MSSNVGKLRFLTAAQVIRLHNALVSTTQPTQPTLLESAVQSPMSIKHYTGESNIFQLAGSLSEKIMKNHAFQDGNKRTALVAASMFLQINGYKLKKEPLQADSEHTLENAHVAVCTSAWTAEQLGQFYQQMSTPIISWTPDILDFRNSAMEY